jgi:hypothetical protein
MMDGSRWIGDTRACLTASFKLKFEIHGKLDERS